MDIRVVTSKVIGFSVVGAVLGLAGSKFLFVGSALSLVPWGIVGLTVGYFSESIRTSVLYGFLYGFFLAFVFMVSGYSGSMSVMTKVPAFMILGVIGAICGICIALVGRIIRSIVASTSAESL